MINSNIKYRFNAFIILLAFVLLPCCIIAQKNDFSHHKLQRKLDSLYYIAHDTTTYLKLVESTPINKLWIKEIITAADIFSNLKKYDKAVFYTQEAIKKGWDDKSSKLIPFFHPLPMPYKNIILSRECDFRNEYFKESPRYLYEFIEDAYNYEYNYDDEYPIEARNPDPGIDYKIKSDTLEKIIDSFNAVKLLATVDYYGMITEKKHGMLFYKFRFAMLGPFFNAGMKNCEKILNLFKKATLDGGVEPEWYMQLVDIYNYNVQKNGYQVYGSLSDHIHNSIPPIKDIKNVDKLRAAIGATTLKNYYKINKIPLNFLPAGYGK